MKIAFRCDATRQIGGGHVSRCLALADYLSQFAGAECYFYTVEESVTVVPGLVSGGHKVLSHLELKKPGFSADVVILDHYELGLDFEREIRSSGAKLVVLDDLCDRFRSCDVLLSNNLSFDAEDYSGLIEPGCRVLADPGYIILRREFANLTSSNRLREVPPKRLLLFFGTTDPASLMQRLLKILGSLHFRPEHIDAVIGQSAPQLSVVRSLVDAIGAVLHVQTANMAGLMSSADLAVGSGGTAIWERMSVGLPAIEIGHSEWQIRTLKRLHEKEYVKYIGQSYDITDEQIAEVLVRALADGIKTRYCAIGHKMKELVNIIISLTT